MLEGDAARTGDYFVRVYNYAAVGPYNGTVETFGPGPVAVKAGTKEAWTLTCEVGKTILSTQKVVIDRGQKLDVKNPCGPNAAEIVAQPESRTPALHDVGRASARPRVKPVRGGRAVRFGFARRVPNPVTVDVFQVAKGRSVILGERRVASFRSRLKTFTWSGRATTASRSATACSSSATGSRARRCAPTSGGRRSSAATGASACGRRSTGPTRAACCRAPSSSAPRSAGARTGR